jgi:alpha-L-arabinofuranosidase
MGWEESPSLPSFVRWEPIGRVRSEQPVNKSNPHYLKLSYPSVGQTRSIENAGYRGIGIRKGSSYWFEALSRRSLGAGNNLTLKIEIVCPDGHVAGSATIRDLLLHWKSLRAKLTSDRTERNAKLRISVVMPGIDLPMDRAADLRLSIRDWRTLFDAELTTAESSGGLMLTAERSGTLDLDMVSLYPVHTWKNRPNGLRADLVQRLKDLQPGFVRFPGGCIVEGRYLTTRYQWKKTIGRPEEREVLINRWNDEFRHRPAPDYFQSFGLGFMEYFQLCEDIGAEPLPVLNCGMACQFNSKELVPLEKLDPYVQDALDLIEFANGPVNSVWGAKRAALGHPKPFRMKYLGVGNEQWGPDYFPRYERFARAIKSKYPEIQIVTSAGPSPVGADFNLAWNTLRAMDPKLVDIVDEHVYAAPDWFLDNAHRYDGYDRTGPKVFMGEYAAQSVGIARPDNKNDWRCALSEAAFMTGLERNGEVVRLSSYAPLFAHVDAWQWTPDLIWFDNLRSYATPNYYVQQMFMKNRGDLILPVTSTGAPSGPQGKERFFVTATLDQKRNEAIVKVVNATGSALKATVSAGVASGAAQVTTLTAGLSEVNSLDEPERVAPKQSRDLVENGALSREFPPYSFTIIRVPLGK